MATKKKPAPKKKTPAKKKKKAKVPLTKETRKLAHQLVDKVLDADGPAKLSISVNDDDKRPAFLSGETCFVLRTCDANMRSKHNNFVWPGVGEVAEAQDWSPIAQCGAGLHGLLNGEGGSGYLDMSPDAKWLVVEVAKRELIAMDDKCKFRRGLVVHVGDSTSATRFLADKIGPGFRIVKGTATAGVKGTATVGDKGTATAGDEGTATAGWKGTATAGDGGALILNHYDPSTGKWTKRVAIVGENGIKPNTKYKLADDGKAFVEVDPKPTTAVVEPAPSPAAEEAPTLETKPCGAVVVGENETDNIGKCVAAFHDGKHDDCNLPF